jgi:class 3 adenylate cyclase
MIILMTDAHHFAMVERELESRGSRSAAAASADFDAVTATPATHPLAAFIQAYYQMLGEAVVRHGGRVIKYIGDGSMSIFPAADANAGAVPGSGAAAAAAAAILCGFELRDGYARISAAARLGVETELEVGIAYGPVVAGTFGHASLRSYDVFGEAVNEAAMITHHRGVAVTGALRALFADRAADGLGFTRLPDRPLKWRPEPLEVWEALPLAPRP